MNISRVAILYGVVFAVCLAFAPNFADAALVRTDLDSELDVDLSSTINGQSSTFTPPDNSLLVLVLAIINQSNDADLTTANGVSGGGLNWTKRTTANASDGGGFRSVTEIWTAPVTTGASMSVSATNTSVTANDAHIYQQIFAYTGYDTADPIGATVSSNDITPTNGAGTMTLSASPDVNSVTVASRFFVPNDADTSATPGTGWTEIYDQDSESFYGNLHTMDRLNSTSATVAWSDINANDEVAYMDIIGSALEIKAESGGDPEPDPDPDPGSDRITLIKPPNTLGLVGYWSFNEGTGSVANDLSGNANDGSISGASWVNGKVGSALSFDGSNDSVTVPADSAFNITGDITISAWVWIPDTTIKTAGEGIISNSSSGVWDYELLFWDNSGTSWVFYSDGTGSTIESNGELEANRWYHLVVTRTGTSFSMYMNGALDRSTTVSGSFGGTARPLLIGRGATSGDTEIFGGMIDEVRIYNRGLSASEVAQLYQATSIVRFGVSSASLDDGSSLENGLIGHWTFDGADTGTVVADRSGGGHNGYFIGGATSSAKTIGKLGQAFGFDGTDDYVDAGSVGSTRSVSFWMKADDTTSRKILTLNGTAEISLDGSSQVTTSGLTGATVYVNGSSGSATVDTGWNHVVVTANAVTASGLLLGQGTASGFFDGALDDVRVYNRVLTAAEISQLADFGMARIVQ